MNPDVLLNRIRLEQRGLIDIHKKLYEMEHLLPVPDPMQFAKTAESAALLSEKSTAHLRNICAICSSPYRTSRQSITTPRQPKLYDDNDLNCDNFAQAVRKYRCSREVITAVANLYLRQQIMLDTY